MADSSTSSDGSRRNSDSGLYDPDAGVKRGLKSRHISMMALAGIIGPGLLVGAGGALASGGPAALLIGFGVVGIIVFMIMQSLAELSTLYPTASGGSFSGMAIRFVDPAFGPVIGWNYFIIWVAVLANEYNTVSSILSFWSEKVPLWGYFLLFWFFFLGFQLLGVTAWGEAEFWLALLKLLGLIAFFFFGLIYAAGGIINGPPAIGFRYWRDPGAFASGFGGVADVFVFCSTFYAGCESVAVAAAETRNPKKAIPNAIRQVFWRIIVIYMGSAFFFGLTVPADSPGLVSNDGGKNEALQSPMTIAIKNAGWSGGVHLVNAFILVTCISAVNSSLYVGSRTVLYMAYQGLAPKILGRTNKRGVPIPAIIFTNLFGCLALMNVSTGASEAYQYIVNLSGVSTFLVWAALSLIHIKFRRAWIAQGHTPDELPYKALWYPYSTYFGLVATIILSLIQGWTTFKPFHAGKFVDAYILIPLSAIVYLIYKLAYRTTIHRAADIDLYSGQRKDVDSNSSAEYDEEQLIEQTDAVSETDNKKSKVSNIRQVFRKQK